jgi:hypothetical protein
MNLPRLHLAAGGCCAGAPTRGNFTMAMLHQINA